MAFAVIHLEFTQAQVIMMSRIILANHNNLEETAYLFDLYRVFYNMPSDITAARQFISERFTRQDSLIFLAFREKSAVGFMQVYGSFSSVALRPIWILNDLFVDPSVRRTGCAKKMLQYLRESAKQQNIFSIKLATAVDNRKAKALYDSLGYQLNRSFDHYSKRII